MKPLLSESGHCSLMDSNLVHRANMLLHEADEAMPPLELHGLSFSWRQLHLGKGMYLGGDAFGMHVHDQLHLESVISGRFRFDTETDTASLQAGQSLLLAPQVKHSWECEHGGIMVGGLIDVSGPAQGAFFKAFMDTCGGKAVVSPKACSVWYRQLLALLTESELRVWRTGVAVNLLNLLLADLLAAMMDLGDWQPRVSEAQAGRGLRSEELCRMAMEFIEANYALPVQLADVALQVGVSSRHLTRIFRQTYGESIIQALSRLRLQKAHGLLREKADLSIKRIAFETGFSSPAYFAACFRREYGMSPRDARRGVESRQKP